jgi:hypothetical protein
MHFKSEKWIVLHAFLRAYSTLAFPFAPCISHSGGTMTVLEYFLKSCILILLPMIPAIVIFKMFPEAKGEGEGAWSGLRWKFGGAFAAYIFVAIFLHQATKDGIVVRSAEVWTVRGAVDAGGVPNIPNMLAVRSLPQAYPVEKDGSYIFKIVVERAGDKRTFPRLVFDLTSACRGSKTVPLEGESGTFPGVKSAPGVRVLRRSDETQEIELDRFSLPETEGACNG